MSTSRTLWLSSGRAVRGGLTLACVSAGQDVTHTHTRLAAERLLQVDITIVVHSSPQI